MHSVLIRGHHGLGDNLHQRAIVRQLLASGKDIWIETPWPSVYHDLPVHCVPKASPLRTQAKNETREAAQFCKVPVPRDARVVQLRYDRDSVRAAGSVLGGMTCSGFDPEKADFRLPVPAEWRLIAEDILRGNGWRGQPVMFYRPLVERTEYASGALRNPDHVAYIELFNSIRRDYYVVSVADLEPGKEWTVDATATNVDATFHCGELDLPTLAGLASISDLVFSAPGFATVLAQAVETPCVTVFGGYERGYSFSAGARHSPYLAVEPVDPCDCFDGSCHTSCSKTIDVPTALDRLREFIG